MANVKMIDGGITDSKTIRGITKFRKIRLLINYLNFIKEIFAATKWL